MSNNFGLPQRTIDDLMTYFASKSDIEKVVIYGSRAKGNFKTGSDIDLAIWIKDNSKTSEIAGELDSLPTPYSFDVTNYNTLNHEGMKNSINTDGVVLYTAS